MKVFYWIMICLTYLQGIAFAVWSIGYVIYYFVKLRKEYEEFDAGIYISVLIGLSWGIATSLLLAALS
jgi:hypothetical protein